MYDLCIFTTKAFALYEYKGLVYSSLSCTAFISSSHCFT